MTALSDDRLRTLAEEHIAYELEMLVWTSMTLYRDTAAYSAPVLGLSQDARNAVLESLLVHARILDDFLLNRDGPDGDDVLAKHYAPWDERSILPAEMIKKKQRFWTFMPGDSREQANKRVAHLTQRRLDDGENKKVRYLAVAHAIAATFLAFLDRVAENDPSRSAWFAKAASYTHGLLDALSPDQSPALTDT